MSSTTQTTRSYPTGLKPITPASTWADDDTTHPGFVIHGTDANPGPQGLLHPPRGPPGQGRRRGRLPARHQPRRAVGARHGPLVRHALLADDVCHLRGLLGLGEPHRARQRPGREELFSGRHAQGYVGLPGADPSAGCIARQGRLWAGFAAASGALRRGGKVGTLFRLCLDICHLV